MAAMTEARSLPQMLLNSVDRWSAKPALLFKERGRFQPISYADMKRRVYEMAAGLTTCGVKPGDRVAIMAENSKEWAVADWAILSLGAVTVPIYPTLSTDQVAYMLRDSGSLLAFGGDRKLAERMEEAAKTENLAIVICVMTGEPGGFLSLQRLIDDGKASEFKEEAWMDSISRIEPNDLATIIYTSGTTGEPKGTMLSHRNFVFLCEAIVANLPIDHTDRFVSFLPISHVYERMAGHFLPIACGAEIAYAESLRTLANDILSAQPTILLTVPRFTESVRTKILATVEDSPRLKRYLFSVVLSRGKARLANKLKPVGAFGKVLDRLVGSKIRARFGGRLRFMVSGGAALPPDLAEFYGAFGILVLQGYGLTETAPVISLNHPDRNVYDSVGEVLPGIEVRIADDGEILMKGPSLMLGYYNKPEQTKEAIDADGWFHTGDLGRMQGRRLWITGRKKDIIVMANGKNVAPERVENLLKSSQYIEEAMVIGDDMEFLAAIIVPAFDILRHHCHAHGLDTSHTAEMSNYPQVYDLIKSEIERINKNLADFEKVKRFKIMPHPWTQESGELTPSLKVKRRVIWEKYGDVLEELKR